MCVLAREFLVPGSPKKKIELVLASASPRRRAFLKPYFRLRVLKPKVDESPNRGERPVAYVRRMAKIKWAWGAQQVDAPRLLVAADTVVVYKNSIFGKPRNRTEAKQFLESLSGRSHFVISSFAVGFSDEAPTICHVCSRVKFRKLFKNELEVYLNSNDWKDKAGAYGIQSGAFSFTDGIYGSLTNIIGLPLEEVLKTVHRHAHRRGFS